MYLPDPKTIQHQPIVATLPDVTDTIIARQNPKRVGLIISAPINCLRVSIAFGELAVLGGGITLFPGQVPLKLWYAELGEPFLHDCHATADGAGTIAVMEIYSS